VITRDALPYVKTVGNRNEAKTYGINALGLERRGFEKETLSALKRAYKVLVQSRLLLRRAVEQLEAEFPGDSHVRALLSFVDNSERGFIR
jgi:UDP-N-acetylglucosamine acyltransferase